MASVDFCLITLVIDLPAFKKIRSFFTQICTCSIKFKTDRGKIVFWFCLGFFLTP